MSARKLLAFTVLIAAGFPAGFCLSSGSAHYFAPEMMRPMGGGRGEVQSAGAGGSEAGDRAGADNGGRGAEASAGPEGQGSSNAGSGGGNAGSGGGAAKSAGASDVPDLQRLLSGNTLRNERDTKAGDRYLSRRGWMGIGNRTVLIAYRWTLAGDRLCTIGDDQSLACETLAMTREAKPGSDLGARLGTVTMPDGTVLAVLRGNVAQMPEIVPLIDGRRPRNEVRAGAPKVSGPMVIRSLVGHSSAAETQGQPGLAGFHFGADGEWITARPLVAASSSGVGGVRVTVGHWSVHDDMLCLDQPGLDLSRSCYLPQQWASGAVRLSPSKAGATLDLSVLSDGA